MTVCITSDQGQILGLRWWNSRTQVDLTASDWVSPCESFRFAKAAQQEFACYWGGVRLGKGQEVLHRGVRLFFALCISPRMVVRGATFFINGSQTAVHTSADAHLTLQSSRIINAYAPASFKPRSEEN